MTDDVAVFAHDLTKRFGKFTAVDSISLEVRRGEIFGFLGANGAGKTTAIRMFCGLLPPSSGQGRVAGYDISSQARSIKRTIGYMSQKFSLYEDLTVMENIEFYGGVYGLNRAQIQSKIASLLGELDLGSQRNELAALLPPGWKQRLALSVALMHEPSILFLDEPTAGVDPLSRRNFWRLIYEIAASGTTIFVTTHYMDEAEYCGRLSIMDQGRIIEIGTPGELKRKYQRSGMQDIFVHLVGRGLEAERRISGEAS